MVNIHLCDAFIIMSDTDLAHFADANTPYMSAENTKSLVKSLKSIACMTCKWSLDNQLKENCDKCHVLGSTKEKV